MNKHIITDQKAFFNKIASKKMAPVVKSKQFYDYVNKEQVDGFAWLSDRKSILDYGCGTGTSIDLFLQNHNLNEYNFYGVDIAEEAIKIAKIKYTTVKLFTIKNNKIPQVKDGFFDGTYMLHVLHHSHDHEDIFKEICKKLKPGGKFLINDLTSRNPIIRLGRFLFGFMPFFIKNRFNDDLLIDGKIPEKYVIDIQKIIRQLENSGFVIEKVEYGHLFSFIFNWVDRFIPFSKSKIASKIYLRVTKFESWLLNFDFFKRFAEIICIKCVKKDLDNRNNNLVSGDYSASFNKYVYNEIRKNSTCLDVGCWTGNLGASLVNEKKCRIDGIDINRKSLETAKARGYRDTFEANLNDNVLDLSFLKGKKYQYIILADILEHLINPVNLLSELKKYLDKDGTIVISLPNVAFSLNRLYLLFGKWDYKNFGTLDKTHLKFFTIKTGKKMVESTGLEVVKLEPYNQFGLLKYIKPLGQILPSLFAYQFLILAKKHEAYKK